MSDGHVHRRAQRYMEKRLLKDLWQAWKETGQADFANQATASMPAPSPTELQG